MKWFLQYFPGEQVTETELIFKFILCKWKKRKRQSFQVWPWFKNFFGSIYDKILTVLADIVLLSYPFPSLSLTSSLSSFSISFLSQILIDQIWKISFPWNFFPRFGPPRVAQFCLCEETFSGQKLLVGSTKDTVHVSAINQYLKQHFTVKMY